ncbi:MAG: phage major capsid protein, partial [Acidimicrobiales bacterium]
KQARDIMEAAEARGESMTPEEEQSFDRLMDERDKVDENIERQKRLRAAEAREGDPDPDDGTPHGDPAGGEGDEDEQRSRLFRNYLRDGLLDVERARALNMGVGPEGGYLVPPQQFVEQLIQGVDDMVAIRQLATVQQLTDGESLGVPSLDTDLDDAEWTSEVGTGSQDDSLRFGKRELNPHPLAKRVKISRTLLRRAALGPEGIVRERLQYKFGVTAEKAYMTGDGNNKPLGLFTATSQGISTSRDVDISTDGSNFVNASGGNAADDLIDAKYTLKPQYWRRARWLFHRYALRDIRKLKDDNGQYVWQPGIAGGRPDTILEIPYVPSEFAPNSFADDAYVGMLADFSFYWIADSLAMEVQRLVELYAESNQVGFIGRLESDGMPVLEEAFVRLQSNDVS